MSLEDSEFEPDADDGLISDESEDETVAYGESDNWGGNDLEAAYRRALEANDAVEWEFDHLAPTDAESSHEKNESDADADDADLTGDAAASGATGS